MSLSVGHCQCDFARFAVGLWPLPVEMATAWGCMAFSAGEFVLIVEDERDGDGWLRAACVAGGRIGYAPLGYMDRSDVPIERLRGLFGHNGDRPQRRPPSPPQPLSLWTATVPPHPPLPVPLVGPAEDVPLPSQSSDEEQQAIREWHCDGSSCHSNRGFGVAALEVGGFGTAIAEWSGLDRGPHASELVAVLIALKLIGDCLMREPLSDAYVVYNDNANVVEWLNGNVHDMPDTARFGPLIDLANRRLAMLARAAAPASVTVTGIDRADNTAHGPALQTLRGLVRRHFNVQRPIGDVEVDAALAEVAGLAGRPSASGPRQA